MLAACRGADAVLLAAVGGPKWDTTDPAAPRPEQGCSACARASASTPTCAPSGPLPALYDASPLKREIIERTDLLVVRELTGGIYFGDKGRADGRAYDVCEYSEAEIERIARTAFRAARSRVTSVDKANVLETSRLWREVVRRVHSQEFPNVELEHLLVDNAAMKLVAAPRHFDVILTENMFGDILSDEAAMLTGSIGMLPSASLGEPGAPGLFEPVHGSAPDIAGEGDGQPAGDDPLGGADAAARPRQGGRRRCRRIGGRPRPRRWPADHRPGRHRDHRRGHRGGPGGADVNQAELHLDERGARRLRGRQGSRTHARAALRHGRLRGRARLREPARPPAIFRHDDHIDRLFQSAGLYYMEIPYSKEEIRAATHETITRNGLKSCYIRPLVYRGAGPMGLFPLDCPVEVSIAVWEWGAYLGDEGKRNGIRGKVSSWRRISPDSLIPAAKATGQYLNSVLAKIEADKAGYEEGILLDQRGMVCEGTGENLFIVKDGRIATPGFTSSILGGINRLSAIEIARDLGYEVVERDVARGELYLADEIFMTGTAAELTPLREIDDQPVGDGPARPGHARDPERVRGRAARPRGALRPLAGRGARAGARPVTAIQIYDTTLRDGMQGEGMSLSARGEGARRAPARRPRHPPHRGRLPGVEPEGGGAVRAARRRALRRRRVAPSG